MDRNYKQFIEKIKQLVGKKVLFKLTDDVDDEGLIGTLLSFNDHLVIEREGVKLLIELYELFHIKEYKDSTKN